VGERSRLARRIGERIDGEHVEVGQVEAHRIGEVAAELILPEAARSIAFDDQPDFGTDDSINVLVSQNGAGQWVDLRVPYPLGFYARGLDARNDDPRSPSTGFNGWKSRAIWSNYGTHFVWHIEGGKGVKGKEVKFQVRPNPLAR